MIQNGQPLQMHNMARHLQSKDTNLQAINQSITSSGWSNGTTLALVTVIVIVALPCVTYVIKRNTQSLPLRGGLSLSLFGQNHSKSFIYPSLHSFAQ